MKRFSGLSGFALKIIAICAMLIDHVSEGLEIPGILGQTLRFFGRLTAPIMFYGIAEGYAHTRSFNKYFLRLLIFALVSHIPFQLFEGIASIESSGIHIALFPTSVIWTLAMGLLAIYAYDKIVNCSIKIPVILIIMALAYRSDWGFFGVMLCLSFWIFRGKKPYIAICVAAVTALRIFYAYSLYGDGNILRYLSGGQWFQLGLLLCLPVIFLSNGRKGKKLWKYTFYVFYPAHLLILYILIRYI